MSEKEGQSEAPDTANAPTPHPTGPDDKTSKKPDVMTGTPSPESKAEKAEKASDKGAQFRPVQTADDKTKLAKLAKTARKKPDEDLILVPVDFSPHSEAALMFAAKLAESMSATLMVLHVVHDPGEMPGYYSKLVKKKRVDRIQDIAKEVFDEFMKQAVTEHPHIKALRKAENVMVIGLPVTRILQVAEKVDPFMVVMGSQGRTGLKHLFLGSKAEQIVHLCSTPVTIVKQKKQSG